MAKTKGEMVPGKRYRGWGFINNYKEFCFEPEQTGSHAGQIREICVREGIRVSESKRLVIVKLNIEKQSNKASYFKELARMYNILSKIFQEYEI